MKKIMPRFNKKCSVSIFIFCSLALCAPLHSFAQELQQYPGDNPEEARKKEAEKLMKQSKMTVEELIKNGIIEDAKNTGDTGDYKAPTQEEMQLEALGKSGNRPAVPMTPFAQDSAFSNEGAGYKSNSAFTPTGDPAQARWKAPPRGVLTQEQYQSQYIVPKDPPAARPPAQAQDHIPAVFDDKALPAVPTPQKKITGTVVPANSDPASKPSDGF